MIENFIYKKESSKLPFWYENKKITLREYQKDLVFYWSGEEDKAEYALFDKSPSFDVAPTICNGGKFGTYSKVSSPIVFDGKNLESLTDNLHLSFLLGANGINGYSTLYLQKSSEWETIPAGDYSLTIQLDGEISRTLLVKVKKESTFSALKNKLMFDLDPSVYNAEVDVDQTNDKVIALKSTIKGKTLKISSGSDGTDLLSLFSVSDISHGTIPTKEIEVIKLNGENSSLVISHIASVEEEKRISKLKFTYSQGDISKTTSIPWNNNGISLDHIEVDIDSSVMYVFLNGELLKAVLISPIKRTAEETVLTINGTENDIYSIEELIIKSKLQNKETFNPPEAQLTKYDTSRPYIDFYFSGNKLFANSFDSLVANCSDNIDFVLNYDGLFYYYGSGAWRSSDGTFEKSNDCYTFADYINEFNFSGKDDVFIRAFFESDGDTPAWIQDLYFTIKDSSIYGDEKETAAILVGEKEFEPDEIIEVKDKGLKISTDKGTTDIIFPDNMTLDELIDFIKKQYPEGIASVYKDKLNRPVLVSETKGDNAYIILSGDAAELIFGKVKNAQGSNPEKDTLKQNCEEFIQKVKKYSSEDLIPIEIKDSQIRLYLDEAINLYKKWRNDEISTYKVQLEGNPDDGYLIPQIIGDWHDIIDILFQPLFPIGFYTGSLDNSEDIISLALFNAIGGNGAGSGYGGFYGQGFQANYHISKMSISGMERILGLDPSWKVLNNRLYIFPNNISKYQKVVIEYKSPVDPIKALRDPFIIQYVYGKIRMAQGEVRGQYGAQLSSGGLPMTMNGDTMFERGRTAVQEAIAGMKGEQQPLGFIYG